MKALAQLLLNASAVFITSYILPGVNVDNFIVAIIVAVVLGIVNMILRPILIFLTIPVTVLTLGLSVFIINALLVLLVARIVPGFHVDSFWWALAFSLILSGYGDIIRIEDKQEFLKRMHEQVKAKISLKEGKKELKEKQIFSYSQFWEELQKKKEDDRDLMKERLKMQVWQLKHIPIYIKEELVKLVEFGNMRTDVMKDIKERKVEVEEWPEDLKEFVREKVFSSV